MIQSPRRMCHHTSGSLSASSPTAPVRIRTAASSAWRGSESQTRTRCRVRPASGADGGGEASRRVAMRAQRRGRDRVKTVRGRVATDSYTPRDGQRNAVSEATPDVGKHEYASRTGGTGQPVLGPHDL